jgi:orotidine-5'-phosphate decarboxylase
MTRDQLFAAIQLKKSFLCVGLDTDLEKIPSHLLLLEDPVFEFNKAIVEATKKYCVAFKINTAFYECLGVSGWKSLEKTCAYIRENAADVFTIADAKRGDIGNTSKMYAKAFFEQLPFDSITVAPYMGSDSVTPFLGHANKWVILLALTSNEGADDFQKLSLQNDHSTPPEKLFQKVLKVSKKWGSAENMMYVVGATQAAMLEEIRQTIPDHFLLIPGVGAQGGSLEDVARYGMNSKCGLLVNSSRNIIYASQDENFADAALEIAHEMQQQMQVLLAGNGLL